MKFSLIISQRLLCNVVYSGCSIPGHNTDSTVNIMQLLHVEGLNKRVCYKSTEKSKDRMRLSDTALCFVEIVSNKAIHTTRNRKIWRLFHVLSV